MIRAQLRIRLPDGIWVTELSRRFPGATFRLLAGYRADDTAFELGEVLADDPASVVDALRSHPGITAFELLESDSRRALSKYETTDTDLYEFVTGASLPVEFPVVVQDGWFELDLTGTRAELDDLRRRMDADGTPYQLQSLVRTTDTATLLTPRQRELLRAAIREGYYEVPRDCTLAALAETVGVDKSTASTVLRRGEATVLKWFLSDPDTKGRVVR